MEEKIIYMVDGKIDVSSLGDFCDGVCFSEFGRPAYDWELGKEAPTTGKIVNNKLSNRFRRLKDGYYLTIRPVGVG